MSGIEFHISSGNSQNLYQDFNQQEKPEVKPKKKPQKKKEIISKSFNEIVEQSIKPKEEEKKEEAKIEPNFETGKSKGSAFSEMGIETLKLNPILENHLKSIGYTNLTKIQQISYEPIKSKRDM